MDQPWKSINVPRRPKVYSSLLLHKVPT
ncbi:uncharacterized protein G2W53_004254 [Senna tora]|uniref:Uncharacterized protein n=1 Tax=Senna tora TaxID=362788 RepID=A0A834XCT2_9FABA|nr:uncharacterized protein G2W53_004254 [Senna tora]